MTTNARILIASIATVHGVRGLVKLRVHTDDPDLIDGQPLFTSATGAETKTLHLKNALTGQGVWLAAIDGVDDRTAAEKLRGTKFYLDRDHLPDTDDDDTFYHADLVGLRALDTQGHEIGTVQAVANFGAGDLLDIKPTQGASFYVPFHPDYVPNVDIESGMLTIQNFDVFANPHAKREDEE